jgi:glyoxylase-like metal-dependent hydrolase (beta-lactamase superfamily II)
MYEIDFLPVGDASRDGDAIAVRFSHGNEYVVGVIDAGFADDGRAMVDHIQTWYETDTVDFVISTHPDSDHIS